MKAHAFLFKLKDGAQPAVDEWTSELNRRMDEVLQSLEVDNNAVESWFQVTLPDGEYLLAYVRGERRGAHTDRGALPIEEYHDGFKRRAWVDGGQVSGRLLVDAATID